MKNFLIFCINITLALFPGIPTFSQSLESKVIEHCEQIDFFQDSNDSLCKLELDKLKLLIADKNNPIYLSYYYRRLGIYHYKKEEFSEALRIFQKSVKISKDLKDKWSLASDYSNIGDVYFEMKEYKKAHLLFQKSLIYYDQDRDANDFFHGFSRFQLGKTYFAQGQIHLALNFSLQATPLMENTNNKSSGINKLKFRGPYLLGNHFLLTRIYLELGNLDKANLHLNSSKYYIENLKLYNFEAEYFLLKSRNYLKKQEKLLDITTANKYLEDSKKKGKLSLCIEYYELFKNYAAILNNPKNEAKFADSLIVYTKKTFSHDKAKAISQYQAQFETQKAEFEAQQAEIKTQKEKRKSLIYLLGLVVSLLSLSFIIYYWKNKQKAQQSRMKIKDLKISSLLHKNELENLNGLIKGQEKERDRIAQDLHDGVGGMLASVKMHFNKIISNVNFANHDEEILFKQTNVLLDESCTEVRRVAHDLHTAMQKKSGLKTQLINLKNAIEISNTIKISLYYDVSEELLSNKLEKQLYKISLELISNTLKHAKASQINLQILSDENGLDYIFEDDGKGFNMNKIEKGLGLISIEKRVKKIGGILQIDSHEKSGSTFIININHIEE